MVVLGIENPGMFFIVFIRFCKGWVCFFFLLLFAFFAFFLPSPWLCLLFFLSALVPSTDTSCLVVGSMMAILFLSLVSVEVPLGGPECAGGPWGGCCDCSCCGGGAGGPLWPKLGGPWGGVDAGGGAWVSAPPGPPRGAFFLPSPWLCLLFIGVDSFGSTLLGFFCFRDLSFCIWLSVWRLRSLLRRDWTALILMEGGACFLYFPPFPVPLPVLCNWHSVYKRKKSRFLQTFKFHRIWQNSTLGSLVNTVLFSTKFSGSSLPSSIGALTTPVMAGSSSSIEDLEGFPCTLGKLHAHLLRMAGATTPPEGSFKPVSVSFPQSM